MKREIKFRVWDSFNAEMILPIDSNGNKKDLSWFFSQFEDPNRVGNNLKLMQFTGLIDIKGKQIWEGDIVETGGSYKKIIIWDRIGWRVIYTKDYCPNCLHCRKGMLLNLYQWERLTILGNIYQNPELLK